jgi:hypothetical protein
MTRFEAMASYVDCIYLLDLCVYVCVCVLHLEAGDSALVATLVPESIHPSIHPLMVVFGLDSLLH